MNELWKMNSNELKEMEISLMNGLDRVKETRIMKDLNIPINKHSASQTTRFLEIANLYTNFITEIEDLLCSP